MQHNNIEGAIVEAVKEMWYWFKMPFVFLFFVILTIIIFILDLPNFIERYY
jgi:hypothetical protein